MSYPYTRTPRPGQVAAMRRSYARKRQMVIGVPGTGKTKVALDLIGVLLYHKKIEKALVVAPLKSIFGVWEEQISIDCPSLSYSILRPGDLKFATVTLINYDFARPRRKKKRSKRTGEIIPDKYIKDKSIIESILLWDPDLIVFDEVHRIKNPYSSQSKMAHRLGRAARLVVGLTGTPKGNKRILDLWSQFEAIYPGILEPTFREFQDHYCIFSGFENREIPKFKDVPNLAKLLRPYISFLKEDELPKQIDIPVPVDMHPKAKQIYKQMEKEFVAEISREKVVTAPIVLAKIIKLSQIAGGFIRTNEGEDILIHRDKLTALKEILDDLQESDVKRVVIFARFRWEIAQIKKILHPWVSYEITGDTTPEALKLGLSLFNSTGGAMVCQVAAGSESLNLQSCNYMILYSIDYSYIHYSQLRKRIHRTGQTKPCYYYQLRSRGTVDNKIYRMFEQNRSADKEFMQLLQEIKDEL